MIFLSVLCKSMSQFCFFQMDNSVSHFVFELCAVSALGTFAQFILGSHYLKSQLNIYECAPAFFDIHDVRARVVFHVNY